METRRNIPIIEPFNEIDQMLTYWTWDVSPDTGGRSPVCDENALLWPADTALPGTYSQWLTDIISFVKEEQDLSDPVHSPLGEKDKLFITSTAVAEPDRPDAATYYLPLSNQHIDLIDTYQAFYGGEGE